MDNIKFIDGEAVRRHLTFERCIGAMRDAMVAVSNKTIDMPPRLVSPLVDQSGFLALMPGSASDPKVYGVKVLSLHPANPAAGLPAIQGFVILFDHESGTPLAVIDGAEVTAIRTAAASGLATDLLARRDVKTHAVVGTGVQARSHIEAILAARPHIEATMIWGRDSAKASAVASEMSEKTGHKVRAVASVEEAATADIISMVTGATEPVMQGKWLRPGVHINLVGPHKANEREADSETLLRSRVFVDSYDSAMREAGDILIPISEGAYSADQIIGEIGHVVQGKIQGRLSDTDITLYKSLGLVAQDIYAAFELLNHAQAGA